MFQDNVVVEASLKQDIREYVIILRDLVVLNWQVSWKECIVMFQDNVVLEASVKQKTIKKNY